MKLDNELPDRMLLRLDEQELAIFLFHGVITDHTYGVRNYTGKHITSDLFARCIASVSRQGNALSMDEVLHYCEIRAPFPPKSFAITFDDGFENNLTVAAPILDDFDVPATIYVTTELVGKNGMSWIDRIENAVEHANQQTINPRWINESFTLRDTESRIRFLKAVRKYVKSSENYNANIFADELCSELGVEPQPEAIGELDRKMSWGQVRNAAKSELITIGGHSHTHPILSFLSPQQLACELDSCLGLLQEKADIEPTHFSYPEGLDHCYSEEVIEELKKRGVRCSPTAIDGTNGIGCDPFRLRRIMVG